MFFFLDTIDIHFIEKNSQNTLPFRSLVATYFLTFDLTFNLTFAFFNKSLMLTKAEFISIKNTTRIPEMLGCFFFNLNKMKTKRLFKSHEPIFYSQ